MPDNRFADLCPDDRMAVLRQFRRLGMSLADAVDCSRRSRLAAPGVARVPNLDVAVPTGPLAGHTGVLTHVWLAGCAGRVCLDVTDDLVEPVVMPMNDLLLV